MQQEKIKLLNGEEVAKADLLLKMGSDDFYYGYMGKNAMSSSSIKRVLDGSYFRGKEEHSAKTKDAFRAGTLIHMAVLEWEKLCEQSAIAPCKTRASRAYKELLASHDTEHVYTTAEWERATSIRKRLQKELPDLFDNLGENEVPQVGSIEGVPYRGKADRIDYATADTLCIDLKTTSRVWMAEESINHFDYDVQLFIYCHLFDVQPDSFIWIFIDKRTGEHRMIEGNKTYFSMGGRKIEEAHRLLRKNGVI